MRVTGSRPLTDSWLSLAPSSPLLPRGGAIFLSDWRLIGSVFQGSIRRDVNSRKEAEKAVLAAYKEVTDRRQALEDFARTCHLAHDYLSDGDIAKLIDFGYSRSRIQQWRNEQAKKDSIKKGKN